MKKEPKYRLLVRQKGGNVIDTFERFGFACQSFPFKHLSEIKDLSKNDWYDEHGENLHMPDDGMKFKAYDLEAKFIYSGSAETVHEDVKRFISFLYGRNDGGSPVLDVYDEYTRTGKSGVYMLGITNNLFDISDNDPDAIAIFSAKFRVTNPLNDMF